MLVFFKRALLCIVIAFPAISQSVSCAFSGNDQESVPVLSRIIINNDSIIFPSSIKVDSQKVYNGNLRLSHNENNIAFEVQSDQPMEYQFMLKGYGNEWSSWQKHKFIFRTLQLQRKIQRYRSDNTFLKTRFIHCFAPMAPFLSGHYNVLHSYYYSHVGFI
jgi:hypothetical protein